MKMLEDSKIVSGKLTVETDSYNEKRYGKPWIAKCKLKDGKTLDFSFGDWIGDAGYSGQLELINIKPGDVVAEGQKDFRKPSNSAPNYWIVSENGHFERLSKKDAILKLREIPNKDDLIKRRKLLLDEVARIDDQLGELA